MVIASRSYWPQLSETSRVCQRLAAGLVERGAQVQVVTAHVASGPAVSYWDGSVPVVQLPHGPGSWWGSMRYWFALADWLRGQRGTYDLVCVSGMNYDAFTVLQSLAGERQPVVLRAEAAGMGGDCHWQATNRFGRRVRSRCGQAAAIVAAGEAVAEELIASGYEEQQIRVIENGLELPPPRCGATRLAARATLKEAHASLRTEAATPVALYTGDIHVTEQLPPLLAFWRQVVRWSPSARLWIISQGRPYEIIPRLAERQGLELAISAPGMFDDLTEFYAAADVYLLPFDTGGQSLSALEAMAAGLPVAAVDSPGNRQLLGNGTLGTLLNFESDEAAAHLAAILSDPGPTAPRATAAREHVARRNSLEQMCESHLALFEQVLHFASERGQRGAV